DATFVHGQALSRFTTTAILRLADAPILPFEFSHFVKTVSGYLDEIEKEAQKSGHKIDFASVRKQLDALQASGAAYEASLKAGVAKDSLDATRLTALNRALIQTERVLTTPEGLPNRNWYKHQIYAPGFYTGYGVKTLPGIREAVDAKNWELATQETAVVASCLEAMNQVVKEAAAQAGGL